LIDMFWYLTLSLLTDRWNIFKEEGWFFPLPGIWDSDM
jgi:hypothetical protein